MLMFLELHLMGMHMIAVKEAETCGELVRLGNFLHRFQISVACGEGECLPGSAGPHRL